MSEANDAYALALHDGAGPVAVLQDFVSPIEVARGVMEKTPHVMLAGSGAVAFARNAT